MGGPCEDSPDDCEDKLYSKFYISVCLMLTVDLGAMCPLNQAFNDIAFSYNFHLDHFTGKVNII